MSGKSRRRPRGGCHPPLASGRWKAERRAGTRARSPSPPGLGQRVLCVPLPGVTPSSVASPGGAHPARAARTGGNNPAVLPINSPPAAAQTPRKSTGPGRCWGSPGGWRCVAAHGFVRRSGTRRSGWRGLLSLHRTPTPGKPSLPANHHARQTISQQTIAPRKPSLPANHRSQQTINPSKPSLPANRRSQQAIAPSKPSCPPNHHSKQTVAPSKTSCPSNHHSQQTVIPSKPSCPANRCSQQTIAPSKPSSPANHHFHQTIAPSKPPVPPSGATQAGEEG